MHARWQSLLSSFSQLPVFSSDAVRQVLGEHWRALAAVLLLIASAATSAFMLWPRPASPPMVIVSVSPQPSPSVVAQVMVHVVGAVGSPGVYRLTAGSRVGDAVDMAGGLSEDADAASLNLAARVADGQQVVVRTRAGPAPEPRPSGVLNLNSASLSELDNLPGIGPALAQRIIERRQRSGPFSSVEQLRDERILPASTYDRIKDLVSAN